MLKSKSKLKKLKQHDKVMAFDFGLKRIGVSFGEKNFCIAHPLTVINYKMGCSGSKDNITVAKKSDKSKSGDSIKDAEV